MGILASHQPDFAPYPGFFYKMFRSDVFILSDDVAYSNSEMHKYNFIVARDKDAPVRKRFSMPVSAHADGTIIKDVMIADDKRFIEKAIKTFEQTYSKHPFYPMYGEEILNLIAVPLKQSTHLADLNRSLIYWIADGFGFRCDIIRASVFNLKGRRDDRLIDLCHRTDMNVYLSGLGAAAYHEPEKYKENDIALRYTDYTPIEYPQYGNKGVFVPNLSMLDYVMNCGFELPKEWRRR